MCDEGSVNNLKESEQQCWWVHGSRASISDDDGDKKLLILFW